MAFLKYSAPVSHPVPSGSCWTFLRAFFRTKSRSGRDAAMVAGVELRE